MKRYFFVFLWMLVLIQFGYACSCVGPQNASEGVKKAAAVFYGEVTKAPDRRIAPPRAGFYDIVVKTSEPEWEFEVERFWKGKAIRKRVIVRDAMPGSSCSFNFDPFGRYIVFASVKKIGKQTIYYPQVCNWTSGYSGAMKIMEEIGQGHEPRNKIKKPNK